MLSNFLCQYNSQPKNNDDRIPQHNDHNICLYVLRYRIQWEAKGGLIILQVLQYLNVKNLFILFSSSLSASVSAYSKSPRNKTPGSDYNILDYQSLPPIIML